MKVTCIAADKATVRTADERFYTVPVSALKPDFTLSMFGEYPAGGQASLFD